MANTYFQFKQFRIDQENSGMKVTTDGCLFGSWVASELKKNDPERILDIGAGTGLLSLMLAQKTTHAKIDAVEINEQAYGEATQNFKESEWNNRLTCHHIPIQDFQPSDKYDLIICNPPFFKGSQQGLSQNKNQAVHSNSLSIQDLVAHTFQLLDQNGMIYLLFPEREMNEFIEKAKARSLYMTDSILVRNKIDQPVFRVMCQFSFIKKEEKHSELIIRHDNRKYTNESWNLLKDYLMEYNAPV